MNKLISSTFSSLPPLTLLFFQQMEKKTGKHREDFSISEAEKLFNTSLRVLRYSNQESSPALMPRRHLCQQSVKYMYNSSNCFTIKNVIADNQEAILKSK